MKEKQSIAGVFTRPTVAGAARWVLVFFSAALVGSAVVGSFAASSILAAPVLQNSVPNATRPRPKKFAKPALIEFHGEINVELTRYFNNRMEQAKHEGVDLLIIEIDSPGGLKIESLEMARRLRDCKWAYTVAIITNEAISGGALVSLGCDEIFIDPNAKFGDIGEIGFDSEAFAWRLIEPKIESYLSRDARDLAESKGRSPDLAEAMVDKDVLVYSKRDEGGAKIGEKDDRDAARLAFKSVRTDDDEKPGPPWQLIPETGPERFLTLSGQRAKELGIAQRFATRRSELATELNVESEGLRIYRHTATDSIVHLLNNPLITGLLVVVGLIGLYVELSAPGVGVGGMISGLCVVLFFWSRFLGGTAGWLEVILFAAGIIFLLMEVFVIPGFGVSGLAGIGLLFASGVLASQSFTFPHTVTEWNQSLVTTLVIMCSGVVFIIAATLLSKRIGSIPIFNRLVLSSPQSQLDLEVGQDTKDDTGKTVPSPHPLISEGDWGVSESLLRPAGRAKFAGRSFDVISDGSFVDAGQQVKVIQIRGNVITVATVDDDLPATHYRS